jgi:putative membrane protein
MRTTFRTLGLLAVVGLLFGVGFARANDKKDSDKKDNEKPLTEQEFLGKAVDANLTEINLAQLAKKLSTNDDVKKFADHLIADHEKMDKRVLDLANQKKVAVASGLNPKEREEWTKLSRLSGKDFDRQFADMMVKDHEEAVKMFEHCEKNTKDETVKKLCEDALPKLRDHLKEAKSLQDKVSGKSEKDNKENKEKK